MQTEAIKSENSQLPEGYKQTDVGVIPEDWEVKKLEEITQVISGGTPNTFESKFWDGDINWFTPTEIGKYKYTFESERKITKEGLNNSSAKMLPKGAILLTTRAGIGDLSILAKEGCTNQGFQSLVPKNNSDNEFLYYLVSTLKAILIKNASGSTFLEISPNKIKKIEIKLPPLPEQQAIAEVLSDVDALITSLDATLNKKRNIKQGTMQLLLTGKKRLPNFSGDWEMKTLGEIGEFKKGKGIKKDSVLSDGLPCIRYGEIYTYHNEYIKRFNSFISDETAKESQKIKFGDLLFAGSGETAEEIGKCVAYLGNEEVYAGGDIIILSPSKCDSSFLGFLMNHEIIVKQKSQMAQGDAVVHIYSSSMKNINVPLPPTIEEQKAIAQILSDMDAEIEALEAKREKYKAIKQGMMQELLTGKIRLI